MQEPLRKNSKAEELNDLLFKTEAFHRNEIQENSLTHLKKEMAFYEATKECRKVFRNLKFCLDYNPPSSGF